MVGKTAFQIPPGIETASQPVQSDNWSTTPAYLVVKSGGGRGLFTGRRSFLLLPEAGSTERNSNRYKPEHFRESGLASVPHDLFGMIIGISNYVINTNSETRYSRPRSVNTVSSSARSCP